MRRPLNRAKRPLPSPVLLYGIFIIAAVLAIFGINHWTAQAPATAADISAFTAQDLVPTLAPTSFKRGETTTVHLSIQNTGTTSHTEVLPTKCGQVAELNLYTLAKKNVADLYSLTTTTAARSGTTATNATCLPSTETLGLAANKSFTINLNLPISGDTPTGNYLLQIIWGNKTGFIPVSISN